MEIPGDSWRLWRDDGEIVGRCVATLTVVRHDSKWVWLSDSNLARVRVVLRSWPPERDSTSISATVAEESWRLARSAAAYLPRVVVVPRVSREGAGR